MVFMSLRQVFRAVAAGLFLVSGAAFAAADVVVNQVSNPDTGPAGGIFSYQIRTSNAGPDSATGITLTDTIPAGSTFVGVTTSAGTCNESGGTVTCSLPDIPFTNPFSYVDTTVQVRLPSAGVYTNTVSATTTSTDSSPGNNTNIQKNTTAVAAADLVMNATASSATVVAGQSYSYTLNVGNSGPNDVDSGGFITISFSVPSGASIVGAPSGSGWSCTPSSGYPLSSGTISCNAAALANGATSSNLQVNAVANVTGSVAAAFAASATKANGDAMPDGNTANNTATVSVDSATGSDVSISGSASPSVVAQGSTVTYTLVPRLNGGVAPGSTGSGIITVTSTLDNGLTYVPNSASGSGWTCSDSGQTVTCNRAGPYTGGNYTNMPSITMQATANGVGSLANSLSINIPETDPNTANNTAAVNITSSNQADLSISKTASLNPVVPGQDFNYNLSIRNNGLLNVATGQTITVTDNIPAGVTVTAPPAGSGWTCTNGVGAGPLTVSCTRPGPLNANVTAPTISIPVQLIAAGTVTNSASVALSGTGPQDTDNTANNTSSVNVTASSTSADLSITKSASGDVDAGTNLTYTMVVTNNGPDPSTNVVLTDGLTSLLNSGGLQSITTTQGTCTPSTMPANGTSQTVSCALGTLANGASATVTVTVRPNVAVSGSRSNTATVTSQDIGDPNRANNSATVTSNVTAVADLSVSKTATPNPVPAGAPLTYQVSILNNGPSSAQNVAMSDTLPTNATFINVQNVSNGGTCTPPAAGSTGGTLSCSWAADVPNGAQRTVTYRVRPEVSAVNGTVVNAVTASSTTKDSNMANNSASTSTPVTPTELDVLINESVTPNPVQLGANTTFTITVTNNGPSLATGVVMTNTFPDPNSPNPSTAVFSYQGGLTVDQGGTCTEPAMGATSGNVVCSFPSLDQGQTATITYQQKAEAVTQSGQSTGTTYNYSSVRVNETETTMANNQVSEQVTTVRTPINADLAITKTLTTPSSGPLIPGDQAVYQLVVTNNGPETSQGAQVIDVLPQGLTYVSAPGCNLNGGTVYCDVGTLANAATATFMVTTTVDKPYTGVSPLENTAQVDALGDPNTANNSSSVSSNVLAPSGIPTLSEWMMGILFAIIGLTGALMYRRKVS